MIAYMALTHSEFEWLKNFSHDLSLEQGSSIIFEFLLCRSKKCLPLESEA